MVLVESAIRIFPKNATGLALGQANIGMAHADMSSLHCLDRIFVVTCGSARRRAAPAGQATCGVVLVATIIAPSGNSQERIIFRSGT